MQQQALLGILKRLGRRVFVLDGTAGAVWGLIAACACLLCGAWLDLLLELPAELRVFVLAISGSAALAMAFRGARAALERGTLSRLAERLDRVSASGGQILSAVDLAGADQRSFVTHHPELSASLAKIAVERATRLAGAVSHRAAAPATAIVKSLGVLALLAAGVFGLTLALPRLAATEWERFADPFGDHPPFSTVTFAVEPGDAKVLFGSGIEIRAAVSGPPVNGVELVLQAAENDTARPEGTANRAKGADEVVPMFPEPDAHWRASVANVTRPMTYFLRARTARSRKFTIDVITVPQIEDVQFRVAPPEYTRMPAHEGRLPSGGLAGLPGTQVTVSIRSNRPLSGGTLDYVAGEARRQIALSSARAGSETVAGTFTISASGRIEAKIVDTAGQASNDKYSAPVTLLVDERPFVRLVEPRSVSFATPTAIVPVVISAEDDYGLARLQLFRSLNDSRYLPDDLPVASPPPRQLYQIVPLPLAAYQLDPGDEIKLFARVEDNDPQAAGPEGSAASIGKGAESSVALIRIISQEEFDRLRQSREGMETLLSKYAEARRRMESLADELESLQKETEDLPPGEQPDAAMREKLKELAGRIEQEAEAMARLAADKLPFKIDEQLTKELEKAAESLERLQKRAQQLAQNDKADRRDMENELSEMVKMLREDRERLEQEAMQPLEKLAALAPLTRDESRFVQLYRRQRDLADRLASLKGRDHEDDPALKARMRDLEDEQRQIRGDLDVLLTDIEEHAAQLPEDENFDELRDSATDFVEAVRASGAFEAMVEAENGLAEFSGTRGHDGAKTAADILEQFLSQCKNMGLGGAGQACRRFRPGEMGNAMGQTLEQLLHAAGMGGSGMNGSGDGYSAARNSMDNVGLYGSNPQASNSASGGNSQSSRRPRDGSGRRGGAGRRTADPGEGPNEAPGRLSATGGTDAAIPLRYRRQVGRYFQRVADELGEQK